MTTSTTPTLSARAITGPWPKRFRVYANARHSGLFVYVNVWESKRAMHAHLKRSGYTPTRRTDGMCASYLRLKVPPKRSQQHERTMMDFAEVNLYYAKLTMRIVTHEMFHATCAWARRIGCSRDVLVNDIGDARDVSGDEERLATVHGLLCMQFVTRATRAGLYT